MSHSVKSSFTWLWKTLAAYEEKTGGAVLAIPHNGNLSNGIFFDVETMSGDPITKAYAEARMKWEPLVEVTQIKGDGETHPFLSPNDEFADYETWDKGNMDLSVMKKNEMLKHEYARSALKLGLEMEQKLGANPFKFGMIGSTDSHTSLATTAEENFFGKHSGKEPSAERWDHPIFDFNGVRIMGWQQAASGLAAVWARENTREAIFDAMRRKETYATTGSRLKVRFFGGWDFNEADTQTRMPGDAGYEKGVPMGGDLSAAPAGTSPRSNEKRFSNSAGPPGPRELTSTIEYGPSPSPFNMNIPSAALRVRTMTPFSPDFAETYTPATGFPPGTTHVPAIVPFP